MPDSERLPTKAPEIGDRDSDHEADREAIRRIILEVEQAFNSKDADALVRHFAANGFAVNAFGGVLTGRASMRDINGTALAGPLREQFAKYQVDHIEFLRADVAIVRKIAWATDTSGRPQTEHHSMIATYTLVKERERWWIVARQNTMVPTGEDD